MRSKPLHPTSSVPTRPHPATPHSRSTAARISCSLAPLPVPSAAEAASTVPDPSPTGRPALDLAFLDGLACDPEKPAPDEAPQVVVHLRKAAPARLTLARYV